MNKVISLLFFALLVMGLLIGVGAGLSFVLPSSTGQVLPGSATITFVVIGSVCLLALIAQAKWPRASAENPTDENAAQLGSLHPMLRLGALTTAYFGAILVTALGLFTLYRGLKPIAFQAGLTWFDCLEIVFGLDILALAYFGLRAMHLLHRNLRGCVSTHRTLLSTGQHAHPTPDSIHD